MPIRRGFSAFIFCLDVIQYLGEKELQTLFAKVYRCLPEGGVLVFDHLPEKLLRQRAKAPDLLRKRRTPYVVANSDPRKNSAL